jgi:hypothetical protein
MRMRSVIFAVLAAGLVTTGACASAATSTLSSSPDMAGQRVVMSASWAAETALNMKALGQAATQVVSGVVESLGSPEMVTLSEGYEAGTTVVYSDATIRTDRSLKGQATKKDGRVSVRLLGGTVDGYTFVYEDEAQLAEGEQVILFLTDSPNPLYPRDKDFQYAVLWGLHGAFRMQGDIGTRSERIPADYRSMPKTEIEDSVR